jgi:hypothetical protein
MVYKGRNICDPVGIFSVAMVTEHINRIAIPALRARGLRQSVEAHALLTTVLTAKQESGAKG